MQNPSQGVAQPLQSHVHLISAHRFALSATLHIEQAFRYLLDAPSIVKQIAPMAWHYISAPQDGTVWLEWLPMEKNEQFPSDGYVWGDPEQTYRQEFNGYIVELRMHRVGYRLGQDQMACHARTRYHLVSKNPTVNAPPPDPSLWLVHYHSSDPNTVMPAQQVPVGPQIQQIMAQRRWLEAQGRLDRREFMLHDREHWPTLHVPGQMQQAAQYGPMSGMQSRQPQQHYPQQAGGQPAAKRPRTSAPNMSLPDGSEAQHETTIEIEEDTALGDFFDHLTQRDISVARYTQHHRWMEEVFSSPYASSQIVPPDLGMGLMGELKGLTDGILQPPNLDFADRGDIKPAKAREAEPFTNLKKEQVEEFGRRIEKHLQEGQAEIERMKAEHAAKMQDWKKVKALVQAEKRLRFATWEGHEGAVPVHRLEEPLANGPAEAIGKENVEDIVKEVEGIFQVKINAHQDSTRIARGGLRERQQPAFDYDRQSDQQDGINGIGSEQQLPHSTATSTPGPNGSAAIFHEDHSAATGGMGEHAATKQSDSSFDLNQTLPALNQHGLDPSQTGDNSAAGEALGDLTGLDMGDSLMDGMDIDVGDASNLDFGEATDALGGDSTTTGPTQLQAQAPVTGGSDATTSAATDSSSLPNAAQPQQPAASRAPQPQPGFSEGNALAAESGLADDALAVGGGGDVSMFTDNDDTFGGLTNLGDDGADGLIDFDAGEVGMDDSAFGDALHGMDEPDGPGGA